MKTITILFATGLIVALSLFLGKLFPVFLPRLHQLFDRKPFNCRPCFTFHLVWIGMAFLSFLFQSFGLLVGGIVLAFIVFGVIRYMDKKQIID